jgi:hypothetical protein
MGGRTWWTHVDGCCACPRVRSIALVPSSSPTFPSLPPPISDFKPLNFPHQPMITLPKANTVIPLLSAAGLYFNYSFVPSPVSSESHETFAR